MSLSCDETLTVNAVVSDYFESPLCTEVSPSPLSIYIVVDL